MKLFDNDINICNNIIKGKGMIEMKCKLRIKDIDLTIDDPWAAKSAQQSAMLMAYIIKGELLEYTFSLKDYDDRVNYLNLIRNVIDKVINNTDIIEEKGDEE